MIEFDYSCDSCGDMKTNITMDSFICQCGGQYRLYDTSLGSPQEFEPHYAPELKQMVYSWKDAEKKAKAYRTPDHPNGLVLTNDNKRFLSEMKHIRRNREDYIQQCYAKGGMKKDGRGVWERESGVRYKPGAMKGKRFDESSRTFIPTGR